MPSAPAKDITEDAALLRAVMDTVLDGLITIDERGVIRSFNTAAARMFGYSPEEVIGKNVHILMPEPYHSEHDGYMKNYYDSGTAKIIGIGREVSAKRKNGSVFPIELGVSEMRLENKRMFVGTIHDISDRMQAERDKLAYTAELERINRDLDAFVYVASHDLKSPLRAIDNLSKWLLEDVTTLDDVNQDRLHKLRRRVQRMENLLDDILEYSRAGSSQENATPVDVALLITEIGDLLNIPEHFRIEKDPSLSGVVVPRMPIRQVFHNLIGNAIKHHDKPNGKVTVSVSADGDYLRFFVTDDGPGIPKNYHKKIFEMFQTLKPRDEVEGSGMGLSLVQKIVTRYGGNVMVESDIGKGSVFSFTWPVQISFQPDKKEGYGT